MLNLKFPEVKRFNRAAAAHRDAARAILDTCSERVSSVRGHDVVYLSGYVVGCSLKALFLNQHPQRKHKELVEWFRERLKHNLEWLQNELTTKGVNFPKEQKEYLMRVRPKWYSEMRYDIRAWDRAEAERVFRAAGGDPRVGERRVTNALGYKKRTEQDYSADLRSLEAGFPGASRRTRASGLPI